MQALNEVLPKGKELTVQGRTEIATRNKVAISIGMIDWVDRFASVTDFIIKSDNKLSVISGEEKGIAEMAKKAGLTKDAFLRKMDSLGLTPEKG